MDIALVGEGPALEAVESALQDLDVNAFPAEPEQLDGFDTAAVIGTTGDRIFEIADSTLSQWVSVEVGGLGGHAVPDIDASVTVFDDICYECLAHRVRAGRTETGGEPSGVRSTVRYAGAVAGRRIVQSLTGEPVSDTVTEVPGHQRAVLPVPHCGCAGTRDRTISLEYRSVDLEEALGAGEQAIDDRMGPLVEVGEQESFPVPYYVAATAETDEFSDVRAAPFAGGADIDWNAAFMKAIGEGLERYAAGAYRETEFTRAPTRDLPDPVAPSRFVTPDEWNHSSPSSGAGADSEVGAESGTTSTATFDDSAELPWVHGIDAKSGATVQLPAEFIQYPPPERRFKPAITTGLGLGSSTVAAALSGLYEVIERDATMISWYSTFEPLGLAIDDDRFEALTKRARGEGLSVTPILLTVDVDVPVVAVSVSRDGGDSPVAGGSHSGDDWPRFAAGSGASLNPAVAARSALSEALQNWTELRAMGPDQAAEEGGAIGHHADLPTETREFFDPDRVIPAAGLGAAEIEGREELDALIDRVVSAGLDPYLARVTTRDVSALGFEAVRAVVPLAQPLFTGEPFFGSRASDVPESMGFEPQLDRSYHPFP